MQTKLDSSNQEKKTTPQNLGSIIKSVRDIMRKDKGLNGDLDRIPMMTWIMFLKFLDDQEKIREAEAKLSGTNFTSTIEPPYRWRDWAEKDDGITGSELLAFINQDEAVRPDGVRGLGLFAYLRSLSGSQGKDRRDVVATVFKGVTNRMINGYLLRDVINKIDGIHFSSTEEVHTLAFLYESLLKEMRDSAGDAGEFYTPRPVIKFIVNIINPQLGETILDPAAGTGGFLVESFEHLKSQCKKSEDFEALQKTLKGFEAKPMPFLLCQMNMLLHGIENPDIDSGNALRFPLGEIGDKDRVDIVMTNPPFGGEEEPGIQGNFPDNKQTAETVLLFLQLIMRKLRTKPKPGRAAVIVPNGTLYDKGASQRIRKELMNEFCLHTVLRFPKGVFEPYTDIATNILFFSRDRPSEGVWFYEHPLPGHRQNLKGQKYSASDNIEFTEFAPILSWWNNRVSNENAWYVSKKDLEKKGYDLALTHPKHQRVDLEHPNGIMDSITALNENNLSLSSKLEENLQKIMVAEASKVKLKEFLSQRLEKIDIENNLQYTRPRVQLHFRGALVRDRIDGSKVGNKKQTILHTNDLIISRIDARNGAMAIVPLGLNGAIATNDFPVFEIDLNKVLPSYLRFALFQPSMVRTYERLSKGSTNRRRIEVNEFLDLRISLPSISEQIEISKQLEDCERLVTSMKMNLDKLDKNIDGLLEASIHVIFANAV